MPHLIDDEFRKRLDRLACKTVLGQVVDSDIETENYQFDDVYPLRFHLRQLSRYIWYDLLKEGKQEEDVLRAVKVVQRQFADYLFAHDEAPAVDVRFSACIPAKSLQTTGKSIRECGCRKRAMRRQKFHHSAGGAWIPMHPLD